MSWASLASAKAKAVVPLTFKNTKKMRVNMDQYVFDTVFQEVTTIRDFLNEDPTNMIFVYKQSFHLFRKAELDVRDKNKIVFPCFKVDDYPHGSKEKGFKEYPIDSIGEIKNDTREVYVKNPNMIGGIFLRKDFINLYDFHVSGGCRFWLINPVKKFNFMITEQMFDNLNKYYKELKALKEDKENKIKKMPANWRESSSFHCQDGTGRTVMEFLSIPIEPYSDIEDAQKKLDQINSIEEQSRVKSALKTHAKQRKTK